MDVDLARHWGNQSAVTEFVLLGYHRYPALLFFTFLTVYLTILLGRVRSQYLAMVFLPHQKY